MPPTIRPATQDDQPAIRRVIAEVHLPRMNLQWPNFVVVEEDREIVGMGQVKSHRDGSRELASIAVVPKRQGDGVGTAVIEALLGREVRAVLHLSCRRELETYYERFGFKRVEQAEYPPYFRRTTRMANLITRFFGIHLIVMRRQAVG
ncbi:MAG TPA: GNAT family N-acetyltransferase [Candidatus Dormibacteraeota bacterium]|nr:GNAT family N-acetyltransferase [Candidatus Dormibacteraeota bacterium]